MASWVTERAKALAANREDAYTRWATWFTVPGLVAYGLKALWTPRQSEQMVGPYQLSVSRDTGVHMLMRGALPEVPLSLHTLTALALVIGAHGQKYTALALDAPASPARGARWARLHRYGGYATLVLMLAMSGSGLSMTNHPHVIHFHTFNPLFAAPWLLLATTLWWSASRRDYLLHNLAGQLTVKACVAVPLARICSALLQRRPGWSLDAGYYGGIAIATAVGTLWALDDLRSYLRLSRGPRVA